MRKIIISMIVLCGILLPCFVYADTTDSAISYKIDDNDLTLVSVESSLKKVSSEDTNGLKSLLLEIIGDYDTVITDYTYQSGGSGYYSHSISIERDWAWIMTCALWIVITFCAFRIIGGILCR